jgi:uncharacterized protein (DUF2147 family)
MKNIVLGIAFVILAPFYAQSQSPLEGKWDTGKENTIVEILEEENELTGRIVSSGNEKVKIGTIMLKDLSKNEDTWTGKVYSLKKKEWFDVEIKPNGSVLDLKVSNGFLSKSIKWKRTG